MIDLLKYFCGADYNCSFNHRKLFWFVNHQLNLILLNTCGRLT